VLLVGALLGSRRGGLSMLTYLGQGAAGLPVFANGGSGPVYLSGPTGGYLIGFVVAAFVTGWLAEHHWDRHALTTALAMVIGNLVIYLFGVTWLASFVGIENAFSAGLVPFIAGDVVKIALAAALLPSGWRLVNSISGGVDRSQSD
jgi:biotin transport system substrate-specific component